VALSLWLKRAVIERLIWHGLRCGRGGHKHRAASCEVFVFSGILGGLLWGGVCRAHAFDREQGRFVKSLRKSSALLVHRDPLDVVASAAFQSFGGNVPCPPRSNSQPLHPVPSCHERPVSVFADDLRFTVCKCSTRVTLGKGLQY